MIKLAITNIGSKWWHRNDHLHRINGPAVKRSDGSYAWYNYGTRHRTDGPAIKYSDGTVEWYNYGLLHRTDGPAVTCYDGTVKYWVNNQPVTEYEYMFISNTYDKTRNISK